MATAAVSLGLIASHALPPGKPACLPADFGHIPALIPSRATLVVVPAHLLGQWAVEVGKFTTGLRCLRIDSVASLKKLSVADIQIADIVLASQNLFASPVYQDLIDAKGTAASGSFAIPGDDRGYLARLDKLWQRLQGLSQLRLLPAGVVCLEMFFWHRIIVDEVHELMPPDEISEDPAPAGGRAALLWATPIHRLFARCRWGLTGACPMSSLHARP